MASPRNLRPPKRASGPREARLSMDGGCEGFAMPLSSVSQRSISASAPGKVILFGEHAVVYGQPAVAAALSDLRIHVNVTANVTQRVSVVMADLPTPIDVSFDSKSLCIPSLHDPPTKDDAKEIQKVLSAQIATLDELSIAALTPLVYLLNRLVPSFMDDGLAIKVSSHDLPVGAGLGSSAAFSVACAAALIGWSLEIPPPIGKPNSQYLDKINQYAFYSEILLHGTPSGIDNAVSSYGGAIVFTKQDGNVSMENLTMPPLEMVLTHTHVSRSTKALVANVRAMYDQHVDVVQAILDTMGAISRQFRSMVLSNSIQAEGEKLLTLVRTNQHCLRAVGVSHPSLDHICQVIDDVANGDAATKLTGAGGGGCAMTLLRPDCDPALSQKIQAALVHPRRHRPWKFSCLTSTVGGDGVLWTTPDAFAESNHQCDPCISHMTRNRVVLALAATGVAAVMLGTRGLKSRY